MKKNTFIKMTTGKKMEVFPGGPKVTEYKSVVMHGHWKKESIKNLAKRMGLSLVQAEHTQKYSTKHPFETVKVLKEF